MPDDPGPADQAAGGHRARRAAKERRARRRLLGS